MAKKQRRLKDKIIIVAACKNSSGSPDIAIIAVSATDNEIKNGDHLERAEQKLLDDGYDEPIVMFDEDECPVWLFEGACSQCGIKNISELAEDEEDFDPDDDADDCEDYDDNDDDEDIADEEEDS